MTNEHEGSPINIPEEPEHRSLGHAVSQFVDAYVQSAGTTAGAGSVLLAGKLAKDTLTKTKGESGKKD